MMEVEHSASSKCLGAFERRRETSTMEKEEEENEGGGAEITMETAVNAADAVHASEGDKCESFSGDGMGPTFFGGDANVGGDNDEKYEEDLDFSIAEASPATCESDPMFGMSFANVNIERIFLYFHYEFVKRDFG